MEERARELSKYRFETSLEALLDFYTASKEEAERQIVRAKEFIDVIKIYLESEKVLQK